MCLFVIGSNAVFAHEIQHSGGYLVGDLVLDKAAFNRHKLMCTRCEKAAFNLTGDTAHGVDTLIAVTLLLIAADYFLCLHRLVSDVTECVV